MKIGILALQGAFCRTCKSARSIRCRVVVEIRNLDDFQKHQSDFVGIDIYLVEIYNHGQALT